MNILITGASKGIGRVIAQNLKNIGNIYVTGRNEKNLKNLDANAYCVCDLSKFPLELGDFIERNSIDVIVNNAGEYIYGRIDSMTCGDIERIFKTNLLAPSYLISKAVPYMKNKKWGRIINIGSISGVMGEAYASLYSSSKAGLIGLTKALALELAEYNITVNTINPGWVDTEMGKKSVNDSEFSYEENIETIPQRRFIEPVEIAHLVNYLISDGAKGLTGQSISLCAGLRCG